MKESLSVCLLICIIGYVLISILGSSSKLKKHACVTLSIVCVVSLLNTVFCALSFVGSLDVSDVIDLNYQPMTVDIQGVILTNTDAELKASLSSIAKSKYGIGVKSNRIRIDYNKNDYNDVKIIKVTVDLSDTQVIMNAKELESYIEDLLCCECEVICP